MREGGIENSHGFHCIHHIQYFHCFASKEIKGRIESAGKREINTTVLPGGSPGLKPRPCHLLAEKTGHSTSLSSVSPCMDHG